jgi:hypothetical protein
VGDQSIARAHPDQRSAIGHLTTSKCFPYCQIDIPF